MANQTLRALRRHHIVRLKAKWKRTQQINQSNQTLLAANEEKQSGKFVHTRSVCSCWMCGNPRKFMGLRSVQERKAMQEFSLITTGLECD